MSWKTLARPNFMMSYFQEIAAHIQGDIKKMFTEIDFNNDGMISKNELFEFLDSSPALLNLASDFERKSDTGASTAGRSADVKQQLEDLQVRSVYGLVEPIKVELPGGTSEDKKLLFLTNKQATAFVSVQTLLMCPHHDARVYTCARLCTIHKRLSSSFRTFTTWTAVRYLVTSADFSALGLFRVLSTFD